MEIKPIKFYDLIKMIFAIVAFTVNSTRQKKEKEEEISP